MKHVKFKNEWYPLLLIIFVALVLYAQGVNLYSGVLVVPVVHILLSVFIVMTVIFGEYKVVRTCVRLWTGVMMIAGVLGALSPLVLFAINRMDNPFELTKFFNHCLHLIVGGLLYFNAKSSIVPKSKLA